ncbi:transcriptional regulator [Tenacibaculum mesophilum]|uniref:Transcriptional regulator n=1 Tax=Tenacibaculum mesophilum TaxID=104268 RepID=A0AAE9MQ64_9FLAO|nr:transcriptional regulator [Tenacibaculum mesophilum]UTD16566.1 transcriptional regulator [Tenacibaculum mesophilum]
MDINKKVCNYIAKEWVLKGKSNRSFALDHNIDEKTVRKILQPEGYRIPLKTLGKICEAREVSLADFFNKIGI